MIPYIPGWHWTCCVVEGSPEFMIFLPLPPKCLGYRPVHIPSLWGARGQTHRLPIWQASTVPTDFHHQPQDTNSFKSHSTGWDGQWRRQRQKRQSSALSCCLSSDTRLQKSHRKGRKAGCSGTQLTVLPCEGQKRIIGSWRSASAI